jgi:hypothetical protein
LSTYDGIARLSKLFLSPYKNKKGFKGSPLIKIKRGLRGLPLNKNKRGFLRGKAP